MWHFSAAILVNMSFQLSYPIKYIIPNMLILWDKCIYSQLSYSLLTDFLKNKTVNSNLLNYSFTKLDNRTQNILTQI